MKALLFAAIAPLLLAAPASAAGEANEKLNDFGFLYPKATLRDLLEIAGELAGKKVAVSNEEDLKIEATFNLPGPVKNGTALKALSSLLMLEGFELVDSGKELELRRVLTPDQVKALREGLHLPATTKDQQPMARPRSRGDGDSESRIVVKPAPVPANK